MYKLFFTLHFLIINHAYCQQVIDSRQYTTEPTLNNAPIIGILAQEMSYHLNTKWPGVYNSYIAASYVKFVEGGGARAVPIWIGKPRQYYKVMMSKVNGILFPGGATWFNQTDGYADAGRHIYEIAKEMNDNGNYMPLFGTCLGFELLIYLSADSNEYRVNCFAQRMAMPLQFTKDFKESQLFGEASDNVIDILRYESVTANFHSFCLTEKNLTGMNLDKEWKVLSYGFDRKGLRFVSSIEHQRYPFYGVQFHPEKNVYEWIRNRNIPHTANAIVAGQYFATFFVDQTRKNFNQFTGVDEENRVLIYNYPTNFTGLVKSAFEQCYLFTDDVDYVQPSNSNITNENVHNGSNSNITDENVHNGSNCMMRSVKYYVSCFLLLICFHKFSVQITIAC